MMIAPQPPRPPIQHHHHHHHHAHHSQGPGQGQPIDIMQLLRGLLQNNRGGGGFNQGPFPFFGAQSGPFTGSGNFGGGIQF